MKTSSDRRSLVLLFLGVAALAGLLAWWGGWALPLVIAAVVVMVIGHEFGHFIVAKRSGMVVTDAFVGFGPVVWSTTRGETRYGVRALLLGGYVKVPGMSWDATVEPELERRTYRQASYPRQVLFASAGSLMHLVMALVIAFAALTFIGQPSVNHVEVSAFTKWDGHAKNAAQLGGFKLGDEIVSIDGRAVTMNNIVAMIHDNAGHRLSVVVDRGGHDLTLHATPVNGDTIKVNGKTLSKAATSDGYLGIALNEEAVRTSFLAAVPASFAKISATVSAGAHAIVHVFSPGEFSSLFHQIASPTAAESSHNQLNRPVSIVGAVRLGVQGAQAGPGTFLEILLILNIFVGLLNMIPMLPLDGGFVAVATYERLRSRRGQRYHADVNRLAPVIYAFVSVLLVLFVCTLYLDIAFPISNPFH
ncbi:MAG: site-2 protease family protein [Acidimicrobiales bacterium]